jgi:hypothetical protein
MAIGTCEKKIDIILSSKAHGGMRLHSVFKLLRINISRSQDLMFVLNIIKKLSTSNSYKHVICFLIYFLIQCHSMLSTDENHRIMNDK